jgi:tetratricopeptide (TPR) repeat protein
MRILTILSLLFLLIPSLSFSQKKHADQLFESGNIKYDARDYSGAMADYSEAIELKPAYSEAYYKRGLAKYALGNYKGSLADYDEAIRHKHNYQEAYYERAYVKYDLGDFKGSVDDFTKTLELKHDYPEAYYSRGLSKYSLEDYTGTITDLTKAIDLKKDYTIAYYTRGLARHYLKDYQNAISDNTKCIELDPKYTNAYYNRGLAKYYLGMYEESIPDYDKSIELNPKYTNAFYNRGLSYYYVDNYKSSLADFNKVIELSPESADAWSRRGLAKYKLKDFSGSVEDFKQALEINPQLEEASKGIIDSRNELKKNDTGNRSNDPGAKADDISNFQPVLPQIWAVVVGVSHYKNPKMNLKYADKDAQDFYAFLKSPSGGSLSDDHITLLTNEKATRGNIIKALNEKFYRAFEDDIVILFIASHGQPDPVGNEVYFLSHDAESDNLGGTAVSQIDIEKVFQRTRAKKKLWIADACHSGGAGLQVRADQSALTNKLLSEIANSSHGMAMFTASSSSEYSYENEKWGGGHGVFTYNLIKGLRGEADMNKNNMVELRELYEYVYRGVSSETNGQQHPELKGTFDNKLPLSVIK